MTAPIPTAPGEPRRLGSAYVLISLIGTGAQGEVWLGHRVNDAATDFIRWTLMAYLREIEDALTAIVPRGTTVRFNLDALLRANPAARMSTHKTAIDAGIYTPAYARRIEGITDTAATPKEPAHE